MTKIKYAKRDVILHRTTEKAVLISPTADEDSQQIWIAKTLLSYLCERRVEDEHVLPCTVALEIPTWKWAEMGLL